MAIPQHVKDWARMNRAREMDREETEQVVADVTAAAGAILERVTPPVDGGVALVHVAARREPGSPLRFAGYATIFGDHASVQLDGLTPDELCRMFRALREPA